MLEIARQKNPGIDIVVRTQSHEELARAMLHYTLRHFGVPPERTRLLVEDQASIELAAEADRR